MRNLNVALSDLGTVNVGGRIETADFGALDQSLNENAGWRTSNSITWRPLSNWVSCSRKKAQVSIPFYYAYSEGNI